MDITVIWEQKWHFSSCTPIADDVLGELSLLLLAGLLGLCALGRAGWPTLQAPQGPGLAEVLKPFVGVSGGRFVPMMSPYP
jgi:hypothetical protein